MLEFFRRNTKIFQFVLFPLILVSFGIFGIQSYTRMNSDEQQTVAKVDGHKITRLEWDAALREQLERARQQMPTLDAKLFDTPEMRRMALETLVRERVMQSASEKLHLTMTDERLQRAFASDPQFQQIRNPDGSLNVEAISAAGMTPEMFAERLRQDLSRRQVVAGIASSAIAPLSAATAALDAMFQQREVQVQRYDAKDFAAKVAPTDAEIEAYYKNPANAGQFAAPEQATVEYVVLDFDALKKTITPTEEELRKYYSENVARYTAPEERRVSDIMIRADKGASKADRDKARAKAEAVLAEVKKSPGSFAEIARKNSEDPVAAEKGGDLDFIGRNMTVKPFEDAVFALKPGEVSGIVESDDGFHIVKVTEVRGGSARPFEAVRAELENEVRQQVAQQRYGQIANEFTNTLDEQPESLKPTADKWKLELKVARDVARTPAPGAAGPFANAKFMEALFSRDSITKKRNTGAIEVGSNQLAAGRVIEYSPARQLPLAEVKPRIRERLVAQRSAELARKAGAERLAELGKTAPTAWSQPTLVVSRAQPRDLPREVLEGILKAPVDKLPVYVGVDIPNQGYAIAKITKVDGRDPTVGDPAQARAQYAQAWADAEAQAYYGALRTRLKAEITAPVESAASAPAARDGADAAPALPASAAR
ncbi:SurA N-terminal domain-containing protein [Piscinibacter koreensis]|uniref:Periplasmic chaperone PpiD n=1 Tax=Piscinibacter koreensis TaxID=2742824 RepID=A0A7Y6NNA6_9BURK|nr:SurA N-terminal domain-containing protein [Schlegelella koreensis]NUZ06300.1 SurA N-terminal domain-containing protein [Schlegelella koreensis]